MNVRRVRPVRRQRRGVRSALRRAADRPAGVRRRRRRPPAERPGLGRGPPSWCSCTAAPRTRTRGTRWRWPSVARWPSTCPATGTPTSGTPRRRSMASNAADVAEVIRRLAPDARAVVGMSLGGLTTLALAAHAPEFVRARGARRHHASASRGEGQGDHRRSSTDRAVRQLRGAAGAHDRAQPDRSESSLRRGDPAQRRAARRRAWVWRYAARWRPRRRGGRRTPAIARRGLGDVGAVTVPVMLVQVRPQSVVDDGDEVELLRRLPAARSSTSPRPATACRATPPVELARLLDDFVG